MKRPTKLYISGPITGRVLSEARKEFALAEARLVNQGYEAINPLELDHSKARSWQDHMRIDMRALIDCDAIVLLPLWFDSVGSMAEKELAELLGIIVFESLDAAIRACPRKMEVA